MYIIDKPNNSIKKIEEKTFHELGFKERSNLQEWIAKDPECLGEELLIIQKEFDGFDDTNERLDLLALDKQGALVVIENKLDDSGKDVNWQFNKVSKLFQNVSPSTDHWISCGSGVSGCVFDFIAATSYADCQLTINAGDQAENKAIFDTLFVEKDEIEKAFGGKLSWERLDEKKTCRISSRKEEVSVKDKSDWEKMIKFQCDTMPRFYDALHDRLAAAKKKANS